VNDSSRFIALLLCAALSYVNLAAAAEVSNAETAQFAAWIKDMKTSPKGPFRSIRWFCKDGTEITSVPGKGYSCAEHGGGVQHGDWSEQARTIRDAGFLIANIFADIDTGRLLSIGEGDAIIKQLLLEQYLIAADDGWILRGAQFYRGAFQMEDERRSARRLLRGMLERPVWRVQRFPLLREAVRLLPHEPDTASLTAMRALSSEIAEEDPGFKRLRDKLHSLPDAADAEAVRSHAAQRGVRSQAVNYTRLSALLDKIYRIDAAAKIGALSAAVADSALARRLRDMVAIYTTKRDFRERFAAGAALMVLIRTDLSRFGTPGLMLDALDASIALEKEIYSSANELRANANSSSRRQYLQWLAPCIDALYGTGLFSQRERISLHDSLRALDHHAVDLLTYETEVRYLARASSWAEQTLRFYFSEGVTHLTRIEPLAAGYFHDRLRGSPLLFYGELVSVLLSDADRLAGIRHELFGHSVSAGVRALNPGLARGGLFTGDGTSYKADGIYVVEETRADLPTVAGLLTAGAGNPVSHVQLLARNLGIPNVWLSHAVLDSLRPKLGRRVVLAVSPHGTVRLDDDGPSWDAVFGRSQNTDILIEPDMKKLDLQYRQLVDLAELRAADAGRIVGPKAANLGELKYHYPAAVADGITIPFGVFRQLLDRPLYAAGPSVWHWMQQEYAVLADQRGSQAGEGAASFLARLREWILAQQFDAHFAQVLRDRLEQVFGPDGSYGVFVRSDTNVEDLPGFTGAGLNLTVPNVVGVDNILRAIVEVWASPFSERAYTWRQARMKDPAQVFPSVLLLRSVPVEKSGVLVTHDIDSGDEDVLSIAVNEGIGGAVAGQAAEELRVDLRTGRVRLMASASAPYRSALQPGGGLQRLPASGGARILTDKELQRLIVFARALPDQYPGVRAGSDRVTMDVEFGFVAGRLALFQIRPFAQNKGAQRNAFLLRLDAERTDVTGLTVEMSDRPQ
jgi:hypothetical protein